MRGRFAITGETTVIACCVVLKHAHPSQSVDALDATRISDQKLVMLKRILTSLHPYEVEIGRLFSEEPFASEPRNHCVPIFETLQDPVDAGYQIIVMPFLRDHDDPRFQTIGELAEFWRQAFEVCLHH